MAEFFGVAWQIDFYCREVYLCQRGYYCRSNAAQAAATAVYCDGHPVIKLCSKLSHLNMGNNLPISLVGETGQPGLTWKTIDDTMYSFMVWP
jgi:hypothetical protein